MATISDIYEILSKAQTTGIDKATAAISKHGNAIARAGKQAAQASAGGFARIRAGIKSLGSLALNVARGALSKLWGGLKALAGLALGGLALGLNAIRDGFGEIADRAGDITDKVKDLAGKGVTAIKKLAKNTKEFVKEAAGFFGAIGKVGAGFVQRARRVAKSPLALFKAIGKGAKAASKALGAVAAAAAVAAIAVASTFLGAVADASPRAGAALTRMSDAFGKAKVAFFAAFGETVAPLLEKIATLMEDPRFIAFATMLGTKVGGAVLKVANILATKTIPNAIALWKATKNLATALRIFLGKALTTIGKVAKKIWAGLRSGFQAAVRAIRSGIIALGPWVKSKLTAVAGTIKSIFEGVKSGISNVWGGIKDIIANAIGAARFAVETAIDAIAGTINALTLKLKAPWTAMATFVEGIWDTVKGVVADGINSVIDIMNGLIDGYNKTLAKLPGASKITPIPHVSLAEGGIVKSPLLAVVGDAPRSPEVVAPLDKLAAMLRDITGGGLGGMQVNINVTVAPGGFATPQEAGQAVADSFVQALRSRGVKLRT